MPSSISSSDVHYRNIPERRWTGVWIVVVLLVAGAMIAWEIKARSMYHLPGTYSHNFNAMWAEERRKLDVSQHSHRLLLIGSSRILWNADLNILQQRFGTRPLQLALPGTGPALILEDIVENTDFDGLVLVGVTPFLFNRLDGGFFGDEAFEWYEGVGPSKRSGYAIHRFASDYLGFLDDAFGLFDLIDRYQTFEDREGAHVLAEGDWKLGDGYTDRQTDMWPPVEVVGSFDNTQITNFWTPGLRRPPESPEDMAKKAEESVEFFAPLVAQLQARGGGVVFIRMPSSGLYKEHDLKTKHRELLWAPMLEGFNAPGINTMDYPQLSSDLDIPEWSHLSRESQDVFSHKIVTFIEDAYLEFHGHSIYDTMGIPARSP